MISVFAIIASSFVTLGTGGGPIPDPQRAQPANLLVDGDETVLIDVGDGAADQLGKAGIRLAEVDALIISHHHFDHTGGLFALLGRRYQTLAPRPLAIFGPPGTKRIVDGLIAAMQPAADVGAGIPGRRRQAPENVAVVSEIADGARFSIGPIKVSAVSNSHYSFAAGTPEASRSQSLSFRFDLADRSIAYTGDTGPSPAVEQLARSADLLVSEVIEPEAAMATLKQTNPHIPEFVLTGLSHHFVAQHLTAEEVGKLAKRAGVRKLVLTHNALQGADEDDTRKRIGASYNGEVAIARDLDRF